MVDELVNMRRRQVSKAKPGRENKKGDYLSILLNEPIYNDPIMIRDTLVTLLFAGRDNTQNSLAWSFYALQRHPKWVQKMREEAMALNQEGHELHYSDLWVSLPPFSLFAFINEAYPNRTITFIWLSSTRPCACGPVCRRTLGSPCVTMSCLPSLNTTCRR